MVSQEGEHSNQWGRVPLWWIPLLHARPNAMAVAIALSAHADKAGRAWPSAENLARETGIRRDRVFEALKELRRLPIIADVEKRWRGSTVYQLRYEVPGSGLPPVGLPDDGCSTDGRVYRTDKRAPFARSGNRSSLTDQIIDRRRRCTEEEKIEPSEHLVKAVSRRFGYDLDPAKVEARDMLATVAKSLRDTGHEPTAETESVLVACIDLAAAKKPNINNPKGFAITRCVAMCKSGETPALSRDERERLERMDMFEDDVELASVSEHTRDYLNRVEAKTETPADVARALSVMPGPSFDEMMGVDAA